MHVKSNRAHAEYRPKRKELHYTLKGSARNSLNNYQTKDPGIGLHTRTSVLYTYTHRERRRRRRKRRRKRERELGKIEDKERGK